MDAKLNCIFLLIYCTSVLFTVSLIEALDPNGKNVQKIYDGNCCCWCCFNFEHYNSGHSNRYKRDHYNCWWSWNGCERCIRYECVPGWSNKDTLQQCPYPLCGFDSPKTDPGACSIYTHGSVITRSGIIYYSGGTCEAPDHCNNCSIGHYSQSRISTPGKGGHCALCTQISHCNYAACMDQSNSRCKWCEGEILEQYGWYAYTRFRDDGRSCQLACSWRDGSRCFPGNCSDTTVASCLCAPGYFGKDCATINFQPEFLTTEMTFERIGDNSTEKVIVQGNDGEISWTNLYVFTRVVANVKAFSNQSLTYIPPSYIDANGTRTGIIRITLYLHLFRGNEQVRTHLYSTCELDRVASHTCHLEESLEERSSKWKDYLSFDHGDRFKLTVSATNGGKVYYYDRDKGNELKYYEVTGKTANKTLYLRIDRISPEYCCTQQPFYVPDTTTNPKITVRWDGWTDALSGIDHYEIDIFKLSISRGEHNDVSLLEGIQKIICNACRNITDDKAEIELAQKGPYTVLLIAYDKAGNHKTARRITMFDDQPVVNFTDGSRTNVTSASEKTNYTWISRNISFVEVNWQGRFISKNTEHGKWLNKVESVDLPINLDDYNGKRSVNRKDNIRGIVKFTVGYKTIFENNVTEYNMTTIPDVYAEKASLNVHLYNGMRLSIHVRAYDIFDTLLEEIVNVSVDFSPPVIKNMWLVKGDRRNISVHNMREFSNLTIEWELYDFHSGIHEIYWRLFDNNTLLEHDLTHGIAYLPTQGETRTMFECTHKYDLYPRGANCYCTPFHGCYHKHFQVKPEVILVGEGGLFPNGSTGLHDGDYYFQVVALNGALHQTVQTIKITIDASSPHEGIVHEGLIGDFEIDYQNTLEIHAYWSDFFDKESGVMFYRYGFRKLCLSADKFRLDYDGQEQLTETYTTEATYTASEEGKYYITVAAYNHALDPSIPVCSDGITIDTTSPNVTEFKVETMRTRRAIIRDSNGIDLWFINENREMYHVTDADRPCIDKATVLDKSKLLQFPVKRFPNGTSQPMTAKVACKAGPIQQIFGTLPTIQNLTMSWKIQSGPGGVHDYEVGISSTSTKFPDRMDFISTKQHANIHVQNPNILSGERFYVLIRTLSKSFITNIQAFGPFIVDTTEPTVDGKIFVQLRGQYLEATWSRDTFIDEEDSSPLSFQFGIGHEEFGTDVMDYTDIQNGGRCNVSVTPVSCTAIHIDNLHWALHENRKYYVTIKAENTAGLVALASSDYIHNTLVPSDGVVVDIDFHHRSMFQDIDDIDFQTDTLVMSGRWYGFHHPHLEIVYNVCVGENADVSTAIDCVDVSNSSMYIFTNLNLQAMKKYYFMVTAVTSTGNITQFSDGVTVIDDKKDMGFIRVIDGISCNDSEATQNVGFTHHSENAASCYIGDINFQSSTNHIEAHWTIPDTMKQFISAVNWRLQEKFPVLDHWNDLGEYEYLPSIHEVNRGDLVLQAGKTYRVVIQLCAGQFCYQPIFSDGVTVTPNAPMTGNIAVLYNHSMSKIKVVMEKFRDPDVVNERIALSIIDYYEWAFTDNSHISSTLTLWRRVDNVIFVNVTHFAFEVSVTGSVQFSKCWRISIRGVTFAKLSSAVSSDIKSCDDINNVRQNIVIDAIGELVISSSDDTEARGKVIQLEKNSNWWDVDRDYTPYTNIISAVWPTLRYNEYTWAVIEETELDPSVFYNRANDLYIDDPCSHPHAVQCGTTDRGYMNALFENATLQHGKRYIVCIHAKAIDLVFEKWRMSLPNISSCSDGVTVDLTPPVTGSVWIGPTKNTIYQSSLSDMSICWNSFTDIEEYGFHVHSSGIQRYVVAIGTSPYGVDVFAYRNVGLVNHVTFHKLRLQDGHTYYASVKAFDHVGHSSVSVSLGVTVDTTPPVRTDRKISIDGRHIVSTSFLNPCWTRVFYDRESGITKYEWSLGSRPGYGDIMPYTTVYEECGLMNKNSNITLKEGHAYYVSVKAYNGIGLTTLASSWAFIVDASPPVAGHIEDGPSSAEEDIDFQTDYTHLSAKWAGFHDPHTTIKEFYISFGTCPLCDDILQHQVIGLSYDIFVPNLSLAQGKIYYSTVTACNTADLCTMVSSDGVIIDSTPPVRGRVLDGREGHDTTYQSSRNFLGATWFGFWDSQSSLSHYTWRAGTTKGASNILPPTNLHLSDMASIPNLPNMNLLPVGMKIYVTVRAFNKAGILVTSGLYSESSSNGFIVDPSPPNITKSVELVSCGAIRPNTLVFRSAMKIQWEAEDKESFIDRQYVSIRSHFGGDFNLSSIKINGIARDYTFTGLDLHDGSYYAVTLIACNGAGLCSNSTLSNVLVDSTAPKPGMFAISTDHASQPQREPEGWMTWSIFHINLAWLGFTDIHSGIDKYLVNVGSTYMGSDLNKVPGKPIDVDHKSNTSHYRDEGFVQTARIETNSLNTYEEVFISIWAINKVGLASPIIHSQFELMEGGDMELIRRCSSHSCLGHCVCASLGEKCVDATKKCKDATNNNHDSLLVVIDAVDFTFPTGAKVPTFTFSDSALAAEWKIVKIQGKKPQWYEWSIGYSRYNTPMGVFNGATDQVWFDAGQRTQTVVSLQRGKRLEEGGKYSVFIRVWYDSETFATFQSPGLIVNSKPPQITSILGKSVKERLKEGGREIDHTKDTKQLFVDWPGKFVNENSIEKFHLYISTSPEGHDVYVLDTDIDPNITRYDLGGYEFKPDITYYTNVLAYSRAGLHTTVTSDGFRVDNNPPVAGVIFDGRGPGDVGYQNSSSWLAATWHGFEDLESGVMGYTWCVTSMENLTGCDVLPWQNVHLNTNAERQLMEPLMTGATLIHKVTAMDVAGHMSNIVVSNGVIVDTTPPVRKQRMNYGENLVLNPSFESFDSCTVLEDIGTHETCSGNNLHVWSINPSGCVYVISSNKSLASDGHSFAIIKGFIRQEIANITIGIKYRVTFFTSQLPFTSTDLIHNEGYIRFGQNRHVFLLYNRPQNFNSDATFSWQKQTFYFTGQLETIVFEIGSYNTGLAIDCVNLQAVSMSDGFHSESHGHVTAHTVFLHDWSSIHAEWDFEDPESPIIDYQWALGYTEGSTQLQDFQSVGTETFASNYSLHLTHNSEVHITVVATNAAGLKTISYADPIIIDLTPPVFDYVNDGEGPDVDYQTSSIINTNWLVHDPESSTQSCQWAIGSREYGTDLQGFTDIDITRGSGLKDVTEGSLVGFRIFNTVRCTNHAGLTTTRTSDGMRITQFVLPAPAVIIEVLGLSKTEYPVQDYFFGDPTSVRLRWRGFEEGIGVISFLVNLVGPDTSLSEVVLGDVDSYTYTTFQGLQLRDGLYTASVTGINEEKTYSEKISVNVTLCTQIPIIIEEDLRMTWNKTSEIVTVAWDGLFLSQYHLYYEVSVGFTPSSGDIIQWQETRNTYISFSLSKKDVGDSGRRIFATVRAISVNGLHSTINSHTLVTV